MNEMMAALLQVAQIPGHGYPRKWDGNQSTETYLSRGEDSALGITEDVEDRVMPDHTMNSDNELADENNEEYGVEKGNKLDKTRQFNHSTQCLDCKGSGDDGCKSCGGDGWVTKVSVPATNYRGTRLEQLRYNPDKNQGGAWPHNRSPQRSPAEDPYDFNQRQDEQLHSAMPVIW